ncbi:MAG: hypothetical protein JF591_19355 [Lysobacter sp.]|nr:hypothetical protein [Lysobacter sp.]
MLLPVSLFTQLRIAPVDPAERSILLEPHGDAGLLWLLLLPHPYRRMRGAVVERVQVDVVRVASGKSDVSASNASCHFGLRDTVSW